MSEVTNDWIDVQGFNDLGVKFPDRLISIDNAYSRIRQNGIVIMHRYVRSYRRLVRELDEEQSPWVLPGLLLRGCIVESDHIGSAHIGKIPAIKIYPSEVFSTGKEDLADLYIHQRKSSNVVGSAILIAPTGSEKTEAALLWAAKQVDEKKVPRLFYTLPYQASMNAMYDRLNDIFPSRVGLLHSRSLLAFYRRLMEQDYTPNQAVQQARRLRNMMKLHYYPLQVFSPYQMLKAAFQLKGYETLLLDFTGSAFIFDEIHAYAPDRLALILEMIYFLKQRLDACFFVMSATMPAFIQDLLDKILGKPVIIPASDSLYKQFIRHKVHLLDGDLLDECNLIKIGDSFKQGNSVLVTCNTVSRAKSAYLWLQSNLPPDSVILIHSRFNGKDRLIKEQQIMTFTGLYSSLRRPVVVVSTQVVEVSLNIDLDILFTDPAPLEALVQRFGRINRGRRLPIAPVYVLKKPTDTKGIYPSELVAESIRILDEKSNGKVLDEKLVQRWLDEIYTGSILEKWQSKYDKAANEFRMAFINNLRPFGTDESLAEAFDRLFDSVEVLPDCLEQEYKEFYRLNAVEASQLLVPISWTQWHRIKTNGLLCNDLGVWPPVVNVPYSTESGLD